MPSLRRPDRGRVGAGAPPDPLAQAWRMRLEAQQPRRVGEHRPRVGLRRNPRRAARRGKLPRGAGPCRRRVCPSAGLVAEVAPAVDHLFGRAAADAELQASAGDEVRRAGVLGHVQRVLITHVDDRRADLDALGLRADRREQRKRRGELAREMVHAKIGAVGAELLGGDREFDRLQQRVGRRARLRLRRGGPMTERQKADFLQGRGS